MLSQNQRVELDKMLAQGFADIACLMKTGEAGRAAALSELLALIASAKNGPDFDWIIIRDRVAAFEAFFPHGGQGHTGYKKWVDQIFQTK
jgi:hypothetical protein